MLEDLLEHLEFIVQSIAGNAILHADRLVILHPGEVHLARCAGKEGDKTNPDHEASSIMRGSGKVGLHPGFVRVRQIPERNLIRKCSTMFGKPCLDLTQGALRFLFRSETLAAVFLPAVIPPPLLSAPSVAFDLAPDQEVLRRPRR